MERCNRVPLRRRGIPLYFAAGLICALSAGTFPAASQSVPPALVVPPPAVTAPEGIIPLAPLGRDTKNSTSGTAPSGDRAEPSSEHSEKQAFTAPGLSSAAIAAMGLGGNSGGVSGLLGNLLGQNTPGTTGLAGAADGGTTAMLLQEILKKLDDIQRQLSASAASGTPAAAAPTAAGDQEGAGRLIRFRLDGYDMLTVCRSIYLSALSEEGFLVTGDCGYAVGGTTQEETFYLLFRKTGPGIYEAAVELSQNPANESTFLFRFSGNAPYTAEERGNAVVLGSVKPNQRSEIVVELNPVNPLNKSFD